MFNFFGRRKNKSKNVAKQRLKLVLVHDRSDLSPIMLEQIKEDIIKVISRYVEVDNQGIEVKLTKVKNDNKRDTTTALEANIPIIKVLNAK